MVLTSIEKNIISNLLKGGQMPTTIENIKHMAKFVESFENAEIKEEE